MAWIVIDCNDPAVGFFWRAQQPTFITEDEPQAIHSMETAAAA